MHSVHRWPRLAGVSAILLILLCSPLWADPPGRVARLSLIQGTVSFRPATVNDWAPARLNYPFSTGDGLWVDRNSKAELHAGSASIQLAPHTDASFLNLDDRTAQLQLTEGTVEMRVLTVRSDEIYEVDTPSVAVSFVRPGWYRVDVDSQGNTFTTVRNSGQAEVTAEDIFLPVNTNQTARIYGIETPRYDIVDAPPLDAFDQWCLSRFQRDNRAASLRYLSRDLIGYEDLDGYGNWRDISGYGPCWIPTQAVSGWAPYRNGRWIWDDPWGWTWVDDYPWGFATTHYGRWVRTSPWGWAWAPGPIVARPYYAPALVAFVGGNNWGFSFSSFGGSPIGWFPLGYNEIYVPPYQASQVYLRNINYFVPNLSYADINRTRPQYVNWRIPGAVTVVSQQAFLRSAPVQTSILRVSGRQIQSATILGPAAPVAPRKESVLAYSSGLLGSRSAEPPSAIQNRPIVVRNSPPPAKVPFEARQNLLGQQPGRPLSDTALNNLRAQVKTPERHFRMAVPAGRTAEGPASAGSTMRPMPGARAGANAQEGSQRSPEFPSAQKSVPGPQRAERDAAQQQNVPGGREMRPPERLGRSQPESSRALRDERSQQTRQMQQQQQRPGETMPQRSEPQSRMRAQPPQQRQEMRQQPRPRPQPRPQQASPQQAAPQKPPRQNKDDGHGNPEKGGGKR